MRVALASVAKRSRPVQLVVAPSSLFPLLRVLHHKIDERFRAGVVVLSSAGDDVDMIALLDFERFGRNLVLLERLAEAFRDHPAGRKVVVAVENAKRRGAGMNVVQRAGLLSRI